MSDIFDISQMTEEDILVTGKIESIDFEKEREI